MDYLPTANPPGDGAPRVKTPVEHQRDVLAIAQQQLALACARSMTEPENGKWSEVIARLVDWLHRLERDEANSAIRSETASLPH